MVLSIDCLCQCRQVFRCLFLFDQLQRQRGQIRVEGSGHGSSECCYSHDLFERGYSLMDFQEAIGGKQMHACLHSHCTNL